MTQAAALTKMTRRQAAYKASLISAQRSAEEKSRAALKAAQTRKSKKEQAQKAK